MDASGRLPLLEISSTGACDLDLAETADVLGLHLDGGLRPLVLIRTWDVEIRNHRALACELGPAQPIYSVRPPRGERVEDYPADLDEWSDFCLKHIAPLPSDGRWLIGGYSFGGVVALEIARKLQVRGGEICLVMMFDTRIPKQHPREPEIKHKRTRLEKKARRFLEYATLTTASEKRAFLRARLRRRWEKNSGKLRGLWNRMRGRPWRRERSGRLVSEPGDTVMLLKRAIFVNYLKYRPRETALPVVQFWTRESLEAVQGECTLGWGAFLRGPFASIGVPGGHDSLFETPNIEPLARGLRDVVRRACE